MDIIKAFGFIKQNNQYADKAMHRKTKQFWFYIWPKQTGSGANPAAYSTTKAWDWLSATT